MQGLMAVHMTSPRPDWFDKLPGAKRWSIFVLVFALGSAGGWVWRHADDVGRIMGVAHWQIVHQESSAWPSKITPSKGCPQ